MSESLPSGKCRCRGIPWSTVSNFARDGGKLIQEFPKGMSVLEVIHQVLEGNPGTTEAGHSVHDLRVSHDHAAVDIFHAQPDQFASPDASGVEQHKDGTRLNVAGGVDQLGYFRRTLRVVQTDAFGFGEA